MFYLFVFIYCLFVCACVYVCGACVAILISQMHLVVIEHIVGGNSLLLLWGSWGSNEDHET